MFDYQANDLIPDILYCKSNWLFHSLTMSMLLDVILFPAAPNPRTVWVFHWCPIQAPDQGALLIQICRAPIEFVCLWFNIGSVGHLDQALDLDHSVITVFLRSFECSALHKQSVVREEIIIAFDRLTSFNPWFVLCLLTLLWDLRVSTIISFLYNNHLFTLDTIMRFIGSIWTVFPGLLCNQILTLLLPFNFSFYISY